MKPFQHPLAQPHQQNGQAHPEKEERSPYYDTPTIPDSVYDNLPRCLSECANVHLGKGKRARDMFLLSSIVAIGASFQNAFTICDNKKYSPDLITVIAAPPANAKHVIEDTKSYIWQVKQHYKKLWEERCSEWAMELANAKENKADTSTLGPRPFEHYFTVPNSTNRPTLLQQLAACPVNVMYSTEAASIFNSFKGGEHSNYKDIILAAWGHEGLSDQKKTVQNGKRFEIERPRLGIVTTTTPEQTLHLTGGGSDGLLSRFFVYVFQEQSHIRDIFAKEEDAYEPVTAASCAAQWAGYVLERALWPTCQVRFRNGQSEYLAKVFNMWLKNVYATNTDSDGYRAMLVRLLIGTARLATILAILEAEQHQEMLYVSDEVFYCTAQIAEVLWKHSCVLVDTEKQRSQVPEPPPARQGKVTKSLSFFEALPREFSRARAYEIAANLDMNQDTARTYMNRLLKSGSLEEVAANEFRKVK